VSHQQQVTPTTTPGIKQVIVLHHPKIAPSQPVAASIASWLEAKGVRARLASTWNEGEVRPLIPESDLIVVLGGDGSMLRAARMAAGTKVPILGVNMGRLGFLSEMGPEDWSAKLPKVLDGEYWLEERMMLKTQTLRGDTGIAEHLALNDVVISRGGLARVIRLHTEIDGDKLTTYVADGLIIATPTGSTAYALAAGGPILPPELHNILVLPIAPHLTLDRAIVLAEGSTVRVNVKTDHQAILTVDGQFEFEMQDGDQIKVSASEHTSRFIRLGAHTYFYHTLLARLEPKQVDSTD
jgi:NAD+ kinase